MCTMIAALVQGSFALLGAIVGSCEGLHKAYATLQAGGLLVKVRGRSLREQCISPEACPVCVFDMQTHDKGIPSIRLRPLRSQDTPQRCMLAANLRLSCNIC